jgi:hypothetical protein
MSVPGWRGVSPFVEVQYAQCQTSLKKPFRIKGSSRQLPFFKTISSSRQPTEEIKEVCSLPARQKMNIVGRKRLHLRLRIKFHGIL